MMKFRLGRTIGLAALATVLSACSGDNDGSVSPPGAQPFAELYEQGILRYLGMYSPSGTSVDGDVTSYSFATGDGPLCLDGSGYNMATRDQGSQDLVIFLQGGGGCWSTFCSAFENAPPGLPSAGILDPTLPGNPVASWNQVYLPYCDGGLHSSDKDNDYDGDGQVDTPQRGLHNLSASLDVAVNTFPSPRRILLTGVSAGAFGTTFALPLVRHLYPDVPIEIINDSGIGVGRPNDPDYLRLLQ
ncbi:MAG: pectin acetylesterase-family hydrolase, partial [Halioglobus sp.]